LVVIISILIVLPMTVMEAIVELLLLPTVIPCALPTHVELESALDQTASTGAHVLEILLDPPVKSQLMDVRAVLARTVLVVSVISMKQIILNVFVRDFSMAPHVELPFLLVEVHLLHALSHVLMVFVLTLILVSVTLVIMEEQLEPLAVRTLLVHPVLVKMEEHATQVLARIHSLVLALLDTLAQSAQHKFLLASRIHVKVVEVVVVEMVAIPIVANVQPVTMA